LRHQREILLTLGLLQVEGLQGFHKTSKHGQGGANFMRHVRHKITPHGFSLVLGGDVTRQQQLASFTVGMKLH